MSYSLSSGQGLVMHNKYLLNKRTDDGRKNRRKEEKEKGEGGKGLEERKEAKRKKEAGTEGGRMEGRVDFLLETLCLFRHPLTEGKRVFVHVAPC